MTSILTKSQFTTKEKTFTQGGEEYRIKVKIRYDDECGNGNNSFSITGQIDRRSGSRWIDECGGCIHEEIAKHFPELKKYIKWHLCGSDEPMYYLANTLYLAGDRDCNGLRKGEEKQLRNGKTGELCWILENDSNLEKYVDSDTKPEGTIILTYKPWLRIGEGKEPDLEGARNAAIWPDATLEQLTNKELLLARLPALMEEFKKDVEELGFIY